MNWLKENWFKIGLLAILIISVAGAFYWYEWRPSQTRKRCTGQIYSYPFGDFSEGISLKDHKDIYKICLNKYGIVE